MSKRAVIEKLKPFPGWQAGPTSGWYIDRSVTAISPISTVFYFFALSHVRMNARAAIVEHHRPPLFRTTGWRVKHEAGGRHDYLIAEYGDKAEYRARTHIEQFPIGNKLIRLVVKVQL